MQEVEVEPAKKAGTLWDKLVLEYGGETGGTSAVEAVFTGGGGLDDPIVLDSIEVSAQKSRKADATTFRKRQLELDPGLQWVEIARNYCKNCTSLGVQPVPEDTTHFDITVTLPAGETPSVECFRGLPSALVCC